MNRHVLNIFFIVILGLFSYADTFHYPFHFDDKSKIVENREIRDFSFFTRTLQGERVSRADILNRRFAGYLTFALNYRLHGLDVTGYHIVNFSIHVINAVLVYLLVILTFGIRAEDRVHITPAPHASAEEPDIIYLTALASSALFISHPLQTQAVTYIIQRVASLTAMFYLLSLVMYIQSRRQGPGIRKPYYILSLISAVLAMKTKEIAFTLPIIIAVYEVVFFKGKAGKRILYVLPLMLTMFIIPLSITGVEKPVGEIISDAAEKTTVQTRMSRLTYLYTQFRVIVTYIRLLIFPAHQSLLYEYPRYYTFFNVNVYLSFLFLLSIFGSGVYLLYYVGKKTSSVLYDGMSASSLRLISFGVLWFFITLSVESGVIPISDVVNEHRVYLPSAGFFIAAASLAFFTAKKFRGRWHGIVKYAAVIFGLIIITLSFMTYRRNTVWQSDMTLWTDVVSKHPNHPTALTNLGEAYAARGEIDKAVYYFNKVIKRYPDHPDALSNLAVAYAGRGQLDRAVELLEKAVTVNPQFTKGYSNLGVIYIRRGQTGKAIEYLKKAIDIDPGLAKVHYNLGYSYYQKGLVDEAIEEYLEAVNLQPDYALAHYDLGIAYQQKGMTEKAEEHFRKAKALGWK